MTVLARRGVGGYRQYRIPALAVTGRVVLCAYDGRPDLDDLPAPIDLLLRRSDDGGRSWGSQQVVRSGSGFAGFGDPSLLVDPLTGAVLLFHAAGQRAGFFESGEGEDPGDPDLQHCDLSVSTDAGLSWSHRRLTRDLRRTGNAQLHGERIAGLFASSGAGCAITAGAFRGRLVQPFVLRVSGRIEVACALSDDHGASWRLGAPIGAGLNESSVCLLPDGRLLLHSRGVGRRWAACSEDGGETFTAPAAVPDLLDPGVNGSVVAAGDLLLASHCSDEQLRRGAVVSRSDDGGASWRRWRTVAPGSAGYTQLAVLPGGRIGIAYEADGYQEIRFADLGVPEPASGAGGEPAGAGGARGAGGAGGEPAGAGEVRTACSASAEAGGTSTTGSASAEAEDATTTGGDCLEGGEVSAVEGTCAEAPGWVRACGAEIVLDVVLRAVVPARPKRWVEAGPTHHIDLGEFAEVDPSVFKEIGQDRDDEGVQVLRTRESLAANLGPIRPGIHAGDRLEVHARVRAGHESAGLRVRWDGQERTLGPGESWLRRDLAHEVTAAEAARGHAEVSCAVISNGKKLQALLRVPTAPAA